MQGSQSPASVTSSADTIRLPQSMISSGRMSSHPAFVFVKARPLDRDWLVIREYLQRSISADDEGHVASRVVVFHRVNGDLTDQADVGISSDCFAGARVLVELEIQLTAWRNHLGRVSLRLLRRITRTTRNDFVELRLQRINEGLYAIAVRQTASLAEEMDSCVGADQSIAHGAVERGALGHTNLQM